MATTKRSTKKLAAPARRKPKGSAAPKRDYNKIEEGLAHLQNAQSTLQIVIERLGSCPPELGALYAVQTLLEKVDESFMEHYGAPPARPLAL